MIIYLLVLCFQVLATLYLLHCMMFTRDLFNSHMNITCLIHCVFSFCLQSVWMQYYRETVSHPDFSSEIKPITPERTGPERESNNKHRSESLM